VSLATQFLIASREKESEMLKVIEARCLEQRLKNGDPSAYECEFSPHETYLDPSTSTGPDSVTNSFVNFHKPLVQAISTAANEVVRKVIK
ncbi:MAG: hypothetical protein JKY61_10700, partial [Planctomycetes bacterium]|nr:hypothetical protein [Planctomycetota bacterium]